MAAKTSTGSTNGAAMPWPADAVVRRPLVELTPYAQNARQHSEAQIDQLAQAIQQWGWTIPILVDESGTIIAGHGRVLAAAKLALDTVPVMIAKGWSDAQKRAYVIADNKLTLNAGWDETLLALELGDLREAGFDLGLTGFAGDELSKLLQPLNDQPPAGFASYDENIATEHECPRCGYVWSGGSAPKPGAAEPQ